MLWGLRRCLRQVGGLTRLMVWDREECLHAAMAKLCERARSEEWSYERFTGALLSTEIASRDASRVKDHRNSSGLLMRIPRLVECATCCVSGFVEAVA